MLARPEWWHFQADNWIATWLHIAAEARRYSAEAFQSIIEAALFGSIAAVSSGQRTKRYQELVVFALVACHEVGEQPPDNLLPELTNQVGPGIAQRAKYVLMALVAELHQRCVQDASQVAQTLLPGVDVA